MGRSRTRLHAKPKKCLRQLAVIHGDSDGRKTFLHPKGFITILEEKVGSSATQLALVQHSLCIYGWGNETTRNYRAFHREVHFNVPLVLAHLRLVGMDL
jgi:hypothetical protein